VRSSSGQVKWPGDWSIQEIASTSSMLFKVATLVVGMSVSSV
jgi:hypothetical protein